MKLVKTNVDTNSSIICNKFFWFLQDSVTDVMELLKRQEHLEAMIQAQNDRFVALQKRKTQVGL